MDENKNQDSAQNYSQPDKKQDFSENSNFATPILEDKEVDLNLSKIKGNRMDKLEESIDYKSKYSDKEGKSLNPKTIIITEGDQSPGFVAKEEVTINYGVQDKKKDSVKLDNDKSKIDSTKNDN